MVYLQLPAVENRCEDTWPSGRQQRRILHALSPADSGNDSTSIIAV